MKNWILIRGIMSGSLHWLDFPSLLRQAFPKDVISTPDILGNGSLHRHRTPLNVEGNLNHLREQTPDLSPRILVGFSLGGMLAMEWALRHSNEVDGLVLINTSTRSSPFYRRLTPYSAGKILRAAMTRNHIVREEKIIQLTTHSLHLEEARQVAQSFGSMAEEHPTMSLNFLRQIYLATHVHLHEDKPQIPVLLINSKNDKVVHPSCSEVISKKWRVPLVSHPVAGHDLTLEDPDWVLEKIQSWHGSSFDTQKLASQVSTAGARSEVTRDTQRDTMTPVKTSMVQ